MVDPVNGLRSSAVPATPAHDPAHGSERARKFSSTLAAWMSRTSGLRTDHSAGDDHETPDPEPIKASAPIILAGPAKTGR